jgi:hypothetical protein
MDKLVDRNERMLMLIKSKMNHLFKEVLSSIEIETKKFDIKTDFFDKKNKDAKKRQGFYAIRKILFTHGNNIITLLDLMLQKVDITPKNSVIQLSDKVIEEAKKSK